MYRKILNFKFIFGEKVFVSVRIAADCRNILIKKLERVLRSLHIEYSGLKEAS